MRVESVEILRPDAKCTVFYVANRLNSKDAIEIADYLQKRTQSDVAVVNTGKSISVRTAENQ